MIRSRGSLEKGPRYGPSPLSYLESGSRLQPHPPRSHSARETLARGFEPNRQPARERNARRHKDGLFHRFDERRKASSAGGIGLGASSGSSWPRRRWRAGGVFPALLRGNGGSGAAFRVPFPLTSASSSNGAWRLARVWKSATGSSRASAHTAAPRTRGEGVGQLESRRPPQIPRRRNCPWRSARCG